MSFACHDAAASYQLPRRNARSFDLDDSATKAAAWVWHLHTSKPGITTEARFISPQSRRRSSGSYDRKASRFQQEATTAMQAKERTVGSSKAEGPQPLWDCGSNLYDTFELVAFSNSLDRSLMEAAPIIPPQAQPRGLHTGNSSPNEPASHILRAMSLPRRLSNSWRRSKVSATVSSPIDMDKLKSASPCNNGTGTTSKGPEKAPTKGNAVSKFVSAMKKAAALRTQAIDAGCKRSTNVVESSQIRPIIRNAKAGSEGRIEPELALNPKVIAWWSAANSSDTEGMVDKLSADSSSFRYDYVCDSRSNYKLSIPMSNEDNYGRNGSNRSAMLRRVRAVSTDTLNGGNLSASHKIRSKSESFSGERNQKIRTAAGWRKHAENGVNGHIKDRSKHRNDFAYVQNGTEVDSAGVNYGVRGSFEGATEHEQLDLHKHLHHHHHHHHHHHYVHHNLTLEAARLHKEAITHARVEQKLVNLAI